MQEMKYATTKHTTLLCLWAAGRLELYNQSNFLSNFLKKFAQRRFSRILRLSEGKPSEGKYLGSLQTPPVFEETSNGKEFPRHTLAAFVQAVQAELHTIGKPVFKPIHPARISLTSGLDKFCISRSRL